MLPNRHHGVTLRAAMAGLLVIAQIISAIGTVSVSSPRFVKETSRPYPCMERPCGCLSYDECWAGDCCCFTLSEKVAWATKNSITPPETAVRKVAQSKKKASSCCEADSACCEKVEPPASPQCEKTVPVRENAPVKIVIGLFDQKCKGFVGGGMGLFPVSLSPPTPFTLMTEVSPGEKISLAEPILMSHVTPPDSPPPRS